VTITYTFAGLPVSEYRTAYAWYTRLLGRPADMFPKQTEAVWRLTPNGAIYVVQDPERAGSGLLTVAVDDLDAYEKQLREAGIAFDEQAGGDAPRRLVVRDGDGNTLALFEDPGQARS
jgi:catechol 2,3-dioxygenase-like lactoylglutathione lyase family enzyme